ncbi:hypothetical protein AAMO2058_000127900 [Amorphochlora amoebiformis]
MDARSEILSLRSQVDAKDAEIARLRAKLAVYEKGVTSENRDRLIDLGRQVRQRLIKRARESRESEEGKREQRGYGGTEGSGGGAGSDVKRDGEGEESFKDMIDGYVESMYNNTRMISQVLDKRRNLHTRLAILTGRVRMILENAVTEQANLIVASSGHSANTSISTPRGNWKTSARAKLFQQENAYLRTLLSDLTDQVKSAEYEVGILSSLAKQKDIRLDQVREESVLLSETLKSSLKTMSTNLHKQTSRLKEEGEVLTSSLRSALDSIALENTALKSQLVAAGVSIDDVMRGIIHQLNADEKQRQVDIR